MDKPEKVFADGIFARQPTEKAAAIGIKARISFKLPDAAAFLERNVNAEGFTTITVRESKKGTWYCELDTFVPKKQEAEEPTIQMETPF